MLLITTGLLKILGELLGEVKDTVTWLTKKVMEFVVLT